MIFQLHVLQQRFNTQHRRFEVSLRLKKGNCLIKCFHLRDQRLCKFIGTKESVCLRKETTPQRTGLEHQHGSCDVMWKRSFCAYGWWRVGSKNEERLANILMFELFEKKIRLNHSCQNLNSHLLPLYTSYTKSGEKVLKCQHNSSCVFVSLILITTLFYRSSILRGEIWFWSSLGLKGFNAICPLASLPS